MPQQSCTHEELEQTIDELGIKKQKTTAADQEQAARGGGDAESGVSDELDQLEKLGELHASGILTDEEFQAKKRQILGLD